MKIPISYQLVIPFARGICGQCARERRLLNILDVSKVPHQIACASATRSELVLPILDAEGSLIAVLDVDSNDLAAFDAMDESNLSRIADDFKHRSH